MTEARSKEATLDVVIFTEPENINDILEDIFSRPIPVVKSGQIILIENFIPEEDILK